ncbi:MAG: single-stranded DNA-binding protein [Patescibacteria group bacterium]
MNLNKVMLIGNLTRDPESKSTTTGKTVTTFSIATNRVWNDQAGQKQQKAEFHNIVAWGKLGDICAQYLKKGGIVYAEGRLETRSWDGQDGVKRYKTEIVLENMQMGPRAGSAQTFQKNNTNQNENISAEQNADDDDIKIEDIPF